MHSFKRYKIKEIIISVHSLCKHWLPRCVDLIIIYFYITILKIQIFKNTKLKIKINIRFCNISP